MKPWGFFGVIGGMVAAMSSADVCSYVSCAAAVGEDLKGPWSSPGPAPDGLQHVHQCFSCKFACLHQAQIQLHAHVVSPWVTDSTSGLSYSLFCGFSALIFTSTPLKTGPNVPSVLMSYHSACSVDSGQLWTFWQAPSVAFKCLSIL